MSETPSTVSSVRNTLASVRAEGEKSAEKPAIEQEVKQQEVKQQEVKQEASQLSSWTPLIALKMLKFPSVAPTVGLAADAAPFAIAATASRSTIVVDVPAAAAAARSTIVVDVPAEVAAGDASSSAEDPPKRMDLYVVVLDESGSMSTSAGATRQSIAAFYKKQREISDLKSPFRIFTFNNTVSLRFNETLGSALAYRYGPSGNTALNDAIGFAINDTKSLVSSMAEKPDDVYIIIVTDGHENASRQFTGQAVKDLIEERKADDWKFVFLGANQDALRSGATLGVDRDACLDFAQDAAKTSHAMTSVSCAITRQKREKMCMPMSAPRQDATDPEAKRGRSEEKAKSSISFTEEERFSSK